MTHEELQAIKARAEAATPGPWHRSAEESGDYYSPGWYVEIPVTTGTLWLADGIEKKPDAEFIAHARTDVPALLAEVERLQHDAIAYQGALGHSLPGSHDGRLSDGKKPENVLARFVVESRAAEEPRFLVAQFREHVATIQRRDDEERARAVESELDQLAETLRDQKTTK